MLRGLQTPPPALQIAILLTHGTIHKSRTRLSESDVCPSLGVPRWLSPPHRIESSLHTPAREVRSGHPRVLFQTAGKYGRKRGDPANGREEGGQPGGALVAVSHCAAEEGLSRSGDSEPSAVLCLRWVGVGGSQGVREEGDRDRK